MKKKFKIDSKWILVALITALLVCVVLLLTYSPDNKSALAMEEISEITSRIHNNFKQKNDYWGLNTKYVIDNSLASEKTIKNDKLISALGNEILVGSDETGGLAMPGAQSFNIIYKNISRKDCVVLATYNLDYAEKLGLLSVIIKNSHEEKEFSWGGDNELPISLLQAKNSCISSENIIIWTFK